MRRVNSRALGLEIAVDLARFLTGREHLHYGLWEDGLEVSVRNLLTAQEAYCDRLLAMFPPYKSLRVLDIGGGTGELARRMFEIGHEVEIVVPDEFLAMRCRQNADRSVRVHQTVFEQFATSRRFDICLFAESLQYINLSVALENAIEHLSPGGEILVGDCFRVGSGIAPSGERAAGGGHPLAALRDELERLSLAVVQEEDVTTEAAPSIELERQFYVLVNSIVARIEQMMRQDYPMSRWALGRVLNRKLIGKLNRRLTDKERSVDQFCHHNRYLFLKLKPYL